jgi:hypothetical protein
MKPGMGAGLPVSGGAGADSRAGVASLAGVFLDTGVARDGDPDGIAADEEDGSSRSRTSSFVSPLRTERG